MENCPACGSRMIGKIGVQQYYCWECYSEVVVNSTGVEAYWIDDEGNLIPTDSGGEQDVQS